MDNYTLNEEIDIRVCVEWVRKAKREFERRGFISERCSLYRKYANAIAGRRGVRIEWHSIHPSFHLPDSSELSFRDFAVDAMAYHGRLPIVRKAEGGDL